MRRLLFLILPLLLTTAGCSKNDSADSPSPDPKLTVERTDWSLGTIDNLNVSIPFTVNVDWSLTVTAGGSAPDWLTVTPERGTAGERTIQLTALMNSEKSPRKAYIDVTYGGRKLRLTVTQSGLDDQTELTTLFDPAFAQLLQERKYLTDAKHITARELAAITRIDVSGSESQAGTLTSLRGIEQLAALKELNCSYNQVAELDLSRNTELKFLNCSDNHLTALELGRNTLLTRLNCSNNQLTALDLSQNTVLTQLNGSDNQLTALDLSRNTALTTLECSNNRLTTLDLSANADLEELHCAANQLTALTLDKNPALADLHCSDNRLTALDLHKNTELTTLYCSNNQLAALDLSESTALSDLRCNGNQLTTLKLSPDSSLEILHCNDNRLTALDLNDCMSLILLNCGNNRLTELDLSQNMLLIELSCDNNQLKALDLSQNTTLSKLTCNGNPGDGATFPITVWTDDDTQPEELQVSISSWSSDGKTITISYRRKE